jgi:hypothetical protein
MRLQRQQPSKNLFFNCLGVKRQTRKCSFCLLPSEGPHCRTQCRSRILDYLVAAHNEHDSSQPERPDTFDVVADALHFFLRNRSAASIRSSEDVRT